MPEDIRKELEAGRHLSACLKNCKKKKKKLVRLKPKETKLRDKTTKMRWELRKASGWRVTRSGLQLVWKTDWNKARLFAEKLVLRGWPSDTRKRWLQTRLEVVEFWEIFRRWNYQDLMTDWLWGLTENSGFRLSNGMDVLIGKKW